jgi:hypothetical protein
VITPTPKLQVSAVFAFRTFSLLLFWHFCWRAIFLGVMRQSGFASDAWAFFRNGLTTDLVFITTVTGLLTALHYASERFARLAANLSLGAIVFGFIFVTGYFQIFEKPAEFAAVGAGLGTIAAEVLSLGDQRNLTRDRRVRYRSSAVAVAHYRAPLQPPPGAAPGRCGAHCSGRRDRDLV